MLEQLSGRASRLHRGGRGFDPLFKHHGTQFSLVERCFWEAEVTGSNPVVPIPFGEIIAYYLMKINLWYSKSMAQWRWQLCEEFSNGMSKTECHSGQQPILRDAMEDIANTVEYILEK